MKTHIQIVAVLHIAFGLLLLLAAAFIFVFFGAAGGLVASQATLRDGAPILGIIAALAFVITGILVVMGLPGVIAGWGLLLGKTWAKPLMLVLAALSLINIPFGTLLGIYTFWALLYVPESDASQPPASMQDIPPASPPPQLPGTM